MSAQSFIYRHVYIYRFIMNILYTGGYKERFNRVIEQIKDLPSNSQILELCFADTYLAEYCKKRGYRWRGIDLNMHFIKNAKELGHDASYADLQICQHLPKADACIMIGSLYHFHNDVFSMLRKMTEAADVVVISEPVSNLSSKKGIIGFFAKRAASVGKGNENFRYDAVSLMTVINETVARLNYRIVSCYHYKKDLTIKFIKNESSQN